MSVICSRCGSTDVECEAVVNPNGHVMEHSASEPDYADCIVVFNDDGMQIDVRISMKSFVMDDKTDNDIEEKIFFYCAGLSDLKSLTEYGMEDFIITECYRFNHWTEEERNNKGLV